MNRRTSYVVVDGEYVAYQVAGDGPADVLFIPSVAASHVDFHWSTPGHVAFFSELASFARFITFDRRGLGASDRPSRRLTWEDHMSDAVAALDAVGSERATVFAIYEGTPLAFLLAAAHPDRVERLVLFLPFARFTRGPDHPAGLDDAQLERMLAAQAESWGRDEVDPRGLGVEAAFARRRQRSVASPGVIRDLWSRQFRETDVRDVLPMVKQPVRLLFRPAADTQPFWDPKYISLLHGQLPNSEVVEVPGDSTGLMGDGTRRVLETIRQLVGGANADRADRRLVTVLFADVVGSTQSAASLGDRQWREVLGQHDEAVAAVVGSHGGRITNTAGDGVLAVFDGPARAVRCGLQLVKAGDGMLPLRVGVHPGEVEIRGDDIAGIAVHVGARIAGIATAGEVLCSRTVKDLVAGSELTFEDRGRHILKGLDEEWDVVAALG